jgi:ketosteroid isomerase-like protein
MAASETVVRSAYEAFARGDDEAVLALIDPDLEWTWLDPAVENPEPQVCRGREQLAYWMGRGPGGLRVEVEEITAYGDRLLVVTRPRGDVGSRPGRPEGRNFHVVTVRDGRIATLRAWPTRAEALAAAQGA